MLTLMLTLLLLAVLVVAVGVVATLVVSGLRSPQTGSALVPVRARVVSPDALIEARAARNQAFPDREWFSPEPLERGERYLVTLSGTIRYYGRIWNEADAFYESSSNGNLVYRHDFLDFDLKPLVHGHPKVVSQDRELHRYVIEWIGSGEKLAILFEPHYRCRWHWDESCNQHGSRVGQMEGSLHVQVAPAPKTHALPAPSLRERATRVRELNENLRNWADPKFRRDYAKRKGSELLKKQDEVIQEYRKLLEDRELLAWIKENDPEVGGRLMGRLETLLLAERLDVAEPRAKAVRRTKGDGHSQASRKKPTPEEHRERRVRWLRVKIEDKAALLHASIEGQLKLRDKAREIVDKNVSDPDERERWYGEIDRTLGEDEDGEGNGAKAERY